MGSEIELMRIGEPGKVGWWVDKSPSLTAIFHEAITCGRGSSLSGPIRARPPESLEI